MRSFALILLLALLLVLVPGCAQPKILEDEPEEVDEALFAATSMRIHPIFTQIKDWNGDGRPDGIEVLIEFRDQFGDPTKAAGTVMFELYDYRRASADVRGRRLENPWIGSIMTLRDQEARWRRTSRTYTFQIEYPKISRSENYVLTADFRLANGKKFTDRVVLEGQEESSAPATKPASIIPGMGKP